PVVAVAHVAAVRAHPTPAVAPVVRAAQPGPAHCAIPSARLVVAGAPVTGLTASSAASAAARRACCARAAASAAIFFCSAVASARLATRAATAAACSACAASSASCTAVLIRSSAITSATTWPDAAVALVCAWQPLPPVRQLPLVVEPSAGGPRAPFAPPPATGPSMPAAELRTDPAQPRPPPEQSSVASTIVQLDAPGTVGAPEFADDPGATGAGAAGSS